MTADGFMSDTKLHIGLLDDGTAIQAIAIVGELAARHNIEWALAGGLAVNLYENSRMTNEIDIIASKTLPIHSYGLLKQGGARYEIQTTEKTVAVDWIVRNDEAKNFYDAALRDSVVIESVPVIKPEWLVILKYIAGRIKDQEDAVFLLSRSNTVNRLKIKESVLQIGGNQTWAVMKNGLQRWYNLADGKSDTNKNGYIDS